MKTSKQRQPCTRCSTRHTSSGTGLCWHCRPCPTVNLKDGLVHVDGLAPLTPDKALQLPHRLADALTP